MPVKLPEEMGIYKRKRERKKKERKHALDQESENENDRENKKDFKSKIINQFYFSTNYNSSCQIEYI